MGKEGATRLWQPRFIQCPDPFFCPNCAFLLLKPICMCAGGTSAPEASAEVRQAKRSSRGAAIPVCASPNPSRAPALVKTHLRTNPTTHKRKALEKRIQLINSRLLINIDLQERLIKRCLISIFQQFCFVAGGSAALFRTPGRSRICLGSRETWKSPASPTSLHQPVGFFH